MVLYTEAVAVVSALRRQGRLVSIMSGDNKRTCAAIAAQLGINDVHGEVLPGDKQTHVKRLQKEGRVVAMIGDGINDSPALAQVFFAAPKV